MNGAIILTFATDVDNHVAEIVVENARFEAQHWFLSFNIVETGFEF